MTHIAGHDRSQTLLLPESLDDYVGPENPVRFIEAFVDGLDLTAAGFARATPKVTGRPGYAPTDLLKLYIYGYLNRVRSSRRLEAETHRNIEVIWLLRHLKPDYKTIADFRRDNRTAFRPVFRQFVRLCRQLDLFGRELLAVDGTRIKAVNNKDRNFTRASLRSSSNWPMPSLTITCNGSIRPMLLRARRVAHGLRTWPRRLPRSVSGARAAMTCWRNLIAPETTRSR
jgi:transposase